MEITPIGTIHNCFTGKFGIPRQSGLASSIVSEIIMEKPFRSEEAFKELEGFSHLWLLWEFSENEDRGWSLTVRPPKLGGNRRVGVFATRSPFRPNPIGLSCVELVKIEKDVEHGPILLVRGADLMDGTPILDIKPYIPYTDAHPDALSGYVPVPDEIRLPVVCDTEFPKNMNETDRSNLEDILTEDPRPAYQKDPDRIYGMNYMAWNVKFRVYEGQLHITGFEEKDKADNNGQ